FRDRDCCAIVILCSFIVFTSVRSEEHTSELQSLTNLVCRLLLEKKKRIKYILIFKTHGEGAGSSVDNAHSQLIPLLIHPSNVVQELDGAKQYFLYFFFNVTGTTEIYPLSLHAPLPI